MHYIWQHSDWPQFRYDQAKLVHLISAIRITQGRLVGHAAHLDQDVALVNQIDTLVQEAIETSAIEGELLNAASVRSSAARRLGLENAGVAPVTPETEQLVQMLVEAVSDVDMPLELDTLYRWQKSLFPERPLFMPDDAIIGGVRKDTPGHPMVVVSQKGQREVIHFEAPPSERLLDELEVFLTWFNQDSRSLDGLIRAGLAHLWLVTLHPFSDGNGRVTRAVSDRALAQDEGTSVRFYSMSAAIMRARNGYYDILEHTQKGSLDVTEWLVWFLETLLSAMERSLSRFLRMLDKARFWRIHQDTELNDRQRKVLNRLLDAEADEFTHGINASKYKSIAATSKATATRDLAALVELGCLVQLPGGGRSTRYRVMCE
ncbi:Fic family protein [Marinobacterium halophilum]|uniref:Fic family protein n=1 Tax=Marinobacterium halophilum TaxID=267374 RepID=A0A2P8ES24_9GAMM|nr:Fic family protein [Marinobacterium halophilum]PSL12244.1 Fic family protein [Marinobacterium halophilum]